MNLGLNRPAAAVIAASLALRVDHPTSVRGDAIEDPLGIPGHERTRVTLGVGLIEEKRAPLESERSSRKSADATPEELAEPSLHPPTRKKELGALRQHTRPELDEASLACDQ